MKRTKPPAIHIGDHGDDGNNYAGDDAISGDDTGSGGSRSGDSEHTGTGSSTDDSVGGYSAASGAHGVGDFESSGGSFRPVGESSGSRNRARNRRRAASSGSDSGPVASGSERTEERKTSDSGPIPREVSFGSLGGSNRSKGTAKDAAITEQFYAEMFELLFRGIGGVLRDPEWVLDSSDSGSLAERLHLWLKSGGSKRVTAFEKMVARWQPFLMLMAGLVAVVVPRFSHTRELRRAQRIKALEEIKARTGARQQPTDAPVQGPGVNGVAGNGQNGAPGGSSPARPEFTRFSREDFRAFYPEPD